MAFDSWADFWAMGKHGVYVWSSYGLVFAVIAWQLWHSHWQRRRFFREQAAQWRREQRQREAASANEMNDAS